MAVGNRCRRLSWSRCSRLRRLTGPGGSPGATRSSCTLVADCVPTAILTCLCSAETSISSTTCWTVGTFKRQIRQVSYDRGCLTRRSPTTSTMCGVEPIPRDPGSYKSWSTSQRVRSGDRAGMRASPGRLPNLGRRTAEGWPYLAPEVQLFYKAKPADQDPKDEIDFAASAPLLGRRAAEWLDNALSLTIPEHHWRGTLVS